MSCQSCIEMRATALRLLGVPEPWVQRLAPGATAREEQNWTMQQQSAPRKATDQVLDGT